MPDTLNILVVDDEQIVLDSVRKHLHSDGYNIITVSSSVEARDSIERNDIDIILTDLMMPEIDGLELLTFAKKTKPNILVIMITGYATINTALQAMQLGAFDYIAKPFTKDELRKVVKRAAELASVTGYIDENSGIKEIETDKKQTLKGIGANSWLMRDEDGSVLLGVERPFLYSIGVLQSVYLPSKGDEIRQGAVYFQVFSTDLRSHSLLSPLSGTVIDVNNMVIENPNEALQDPYGSGWLIKLNPSDFEREVELIGL